MFEFVLVNHWLMDEDDEFYVTETHLQTALPSKVVTFWISNDHSSVIDYKYQ